MYRKETVSEMLEQGPNTECLGDPSMKPTSKLKCRL